MFKVVEEKPRTALVSFPQGIPWNVEEMQVSVQERASKKKRKRKVTASLNGFEFIGSDAHKYDASKYAIGVLDESTGVVEVVPVDHPYILRPQVRLQSGIRRESSGLTNYERKQSLTEAFGSKKKQRAQRAMASNVISTENISGVGAVEAVMSELADNGGPGIETIVNAADKALEAHRKNFLPPFDLSATDVKNCYPLHLLIPTNVIDSLSEIYEVAGAENFADSSLSLIDLLEEQIRERSSGSSNLVFNLFLEMKSSLSLIISKDGENSKKQKKFEKKFREKYCLLLYLLFAMELYLKLSTTHNHIMPKEDFIQALSTPSNSMIVSRHFQDSFLEFKKIGGKHMVFSTKQLL